MDMEKAVVLVKQIFHLQIVSENTEQCVSILKNTFLEDNQVKIDYFRKGTLFIEVEGGYGTFFDSTESSEVFMKKCVWFISENTKIFYKNQHILSWGFNCNLSYVEALHKALSE